MLHDLQLVLCCVSKCTMMYIRARYRATNIYNKAAYALLALSIKHVPTHEEQFD